MNSTRRQFLNRILGGGVAIVAAYILYPVIRFLSPPSVALGEQSKVFVTDTGIMKRNTAKYFKFLDEPAVLVRLPNGTYTSLSAKCTHLGCTVQFRSDGDYFHCACHGSEFAITGKVMRGPAVLPLPKYQVSVSGEKIFVSVPIEPA